MTYPGGTSSRDSTLPIGVIVPAINALGIDVHASPNSVPDILGNYVSAYMAYHSCWYKDYSGTAFPDKPCKMAGHTHVGINVTAENGRKALKVQLDKLIDSL